MNIIKKLFGKNKEEKKVVSDVPEVATLSYGYHVIPVDTLRTGIQKGGAVKALCPIEQRMIPLKDLGSSLILFDPKTGERTPFIEYDGEEFKDVYNYIYNGRSLNHRKYEEEEVEVESEEE